MTTRSPVLTVLRYLLVMLALMPAFSHAALVCEASPGDDGTNTEAGTPGPLLFFQPTGSVSAGASSIPLSATSGLAAGDMVLVIQMQGAGIDSSNTDSYGDGVAGDPAAGWLNNSDFTAGRYEYASVDSVSGGGINLVSPLTNAYVRENSSASKGRSRYQVIRVPQYANLTLTGDLTAPAWDGETGGVLPLDVAGTLDFNGYTINLDARGFRGGRARHHTGRSGASNSDYRNTSSNTTTGAHSSKGEGIAGTPRYVWDGIFTNDTGVEGYPNGSYAMGAPGNAGGGGTDGRPSNNDENAGGGGGGNGGAGGRGGNSWNSDLPVGGFGGAAFPSFPSRLVMGGGGGGGSSNNNPAIPPHGGVGGGIVLVRADHLAGAGYISVNGGDGNSPQSPTNDAAGGGAAGGSVILLANSQSGSIFIDAVGGAGGNADPGGATHGPGGGGGGGTVYANLNISPIVNIAQGSSGFTVTPGDYYGASPSGGVIGNGIPNTDPDDVDGVSSGADCADNVDLVINKTRNGGPMQAGSSTQFLVEINNSGPDATTSTITVTDVLDSRLTYSGFSGTGWSCTESPAQTLTCTYSNAIASGAAAPDLLIDVFIDATATGNVSNTVDVATSGSDIDGDMTNNSDTLSDNINGPASGTKNLYAYFSNAGGGDADTLQRLVPGSNSDSTVDGDGGSLTLTMTPSFVRDFTISAGSVPVYLCMRASGWQTNNNRQIQVDLNVTGSTTASIGSVTENVSGTNWRTVVFTMNLGSDLVILAGSQLELTITNNANRWWRYVDAISTDGNCGGSGSPSRVEMDSTTVINVDTVAAYDAAWSGGSTLSTVVDDGSTIYVRSQASDPFGSFDITDATFELLDKDSNVVSGPTAMTEVNDNVAAGEKTYELALTVPSWSGSPYTLRVIADEGTEGTVQHSKTTTLTVNPQPPMLMVTKVASQTMANPSDVVAYTVEVSNAGLGDAVNVNVVDRLSTFTSLALDTYGAGQHVEFVDGSPSSGLMFTTVEYSSDDGATWTYTPVSGAGAPAGFDGNVTHFRVFFSGSLPPGGNLNINYEVMID